MAHELPVLKLTLEYKLKYLQEECDIENSNFLKIVMRYYMGSKNLKRKFVDFSLLFFFLLSIEIPLCAMGKSLAGKKTHLEST